MSKFSTLLSQRRGSKRRRLSAEPLEARRLLAASMGWDGPGLGSAELTYHIANSPDSLTQAETNAAIETALDAWASVADITFTPTDQSGLRDSIDLSFTRIDGVGGTLAQAYFPDDVNSDRIAGDVQFDLADAWEVGNSLGNQAFDLVYVAVHEIGHSLGLDHTAAMGSVLAPFVSPSQSFNGLDSSDAVAIGDLYAVADVVTGSESPVDEVPSDESPVDETPTPETNTDTSDSDDDRFPRNRWRRGGGWHRWGGRLDAETPEYNYVHPTDVNSDGNTSALDALAVINSMQQNSADVAIVDFDQATEPIDDAAIVVDEVDGDETIDDGGLVDDTNGDPFCDTGVRHRSHRYDVGLFGNDAESLVTRFDTDGDAALSEDEVPNRLWAKLADFEADTNADGFVSLAELELAVTAAAQESFNEKDADSDGLLVETEVSDRFWAKVSPADTDGDDGVSFDEFSAFISEGLAHDSGNDPVDFGRHGHHGRGHHRSADAVFTAFGRLAGRR
ncbi:Matrixin [Rubripirellula lacrimiformis]|uniref:Matrixin n=1 Tax=Rubripirellula lacrimiformis TaxID=1930273 RepID=A0A517NAE4_9BACT|nr:matrixin family metalloprotease [Rubripirellula lacrimiformis]QDT03988.1 Matrixin [Rubripirellula lacrimiformis]